MKFEKVDNKIIIYIIDKDIILDDYEIKCLILDVLDKLSDEYNLDLKDSYVVNFYRNEFYGIIIELIEEDIRFLNNSINIKLNVVDDKLFLYELDDPLEYIKHDIYYFDKKYYISLKKYDITIFENSNIIYDDDVYKIIGRGIKI